jgi:hypothetical protein
VSRFRRRGDDARGHGFGAAKAPAREDGEEAVQAREGNT